VKEVKLLKIVLTDESVVGGIIIKLSLLWWVFFTTLKHNRTYMSISDLIAYLDVEEKDQAKDG
jgi:hypothetical protein